jgi:hypothetical protein
MAEDSKQEKMDKDLASELEFAVRAISADPHLRTLFRYFLSYCRVLPPASVFDLNPVQNAFNQGVQAAGLELANILTSVEPRLVPTLMIEELTDEEQP